VRPDGLRVKDILFALQRIRERCPLELSAFEADEMVQVWVIHHLQMMGEAAARVTPETRETATDVPWRELNALRNVLVHQYFGIDLIEVWNTVWMDVLPLEPSIVRLLATLDEVES
jgi:uncharacterized protein with HEPN domain